MIETDYLVVGAGAAGMAFADALVAEADVEVVLVDRRHAPGGHWLDAYPFVRLHQPSATYGVSSRPLGNDTIDTSGPNAGFYERATAAEICDYYRRVLDDHLVPSGKVRFHGNTDYVGDFNGEHAITSRVTGRTTPVRVRRKVVDATYLETSVPATHTPTFTSDPDATVVPIGDLVRIAGAPTGFTVLGSGKTAMDACTWLLDQGVDPDRIRWVRPRDAWLMDRASFQPLDLVVDAVAGFALAVEALATAEDIDDLFRRTEACGQLARLDPTIEPTMFRGAILSAAEREALAQIERVLRLGHVRHIGSDRVALDGGTVTSGPGELYVDCTAYGVRPIGERPIFEPGRITLQTLQGGLTSFSAALLAYVETARDDDTEKNRLCPPTIQTGNATDWIRVLRASLAMFAAHTAEPDLAAWRDRSRMNALRGLEDHLDDPRLQAAMAQMMNHLAPALENADRLLAQMADGTKRDSELAAT